MSETPKLALYEYATCPFCRRVRGFLQQIGRDVESRDIMNEPEHLAELVAATGRQSVPCLRIESEGGGVQWMHESADIIAWLRDHFAEA